MSDIVTYEMLLEECEKYKALYYAQVDATLRWKDVAKEICKEYYAKLIDLKATEKELKEKWGEFF